MRTSEMITSSVLLCPPWTRVDTRLSSSSPSHASNTSYPSWRRRPASNDRSSALSSATRTRVGAAVAASAMLRCSGSAMGDSLLERASTGGGRAAPTRTRLQLLDGLDQVHEVHRL